MLRQDAAAQPSQGTSKWRVIPGFGYLIDLKNWLVGGKTVDVVPSKTTVDISPALDNFEKGLSTALEGLEKKKEMWSAKEIALLGCAESAAVAEEESIVVDTTIAERVKAWFVNIHDKFNQVFLSPAAELKEIENHIKPHLDQLIAHIEEKCNALKKAGKEKKSIEAEICRSVIAMLEEGIILVNRVQGELKNARAKAEFNHEFGNELARILLKTISTLPIPDFDLSPAYLHELYGQIAPEGAQINRMIQTAIIAANEADDEIVHAESSMISSVPKIPPFLRLQQQVIPKDPDEQSAQRARRRAGVGM